jgi:hypothetical protein
VDTNEPEDPDTRRVTVETSGAALLLTILAAVQQSKIQKGSRR